MAIQTVICGWSLSGKRYLRGILLLLLFGQFLARLGVATITAAAAGRRTGTAGHGIVRNGEDRVDRRFEHHPQRGQTVLVRNEGVARLLDAVEMRSIHKVDQMGCGQEKD